jgi:hypothetical protein
MSDASDSTTPPPEPLHEGKLYTIEKEGGLYNVDCEGETVIDAIALHDRELPAFLRLVYARNEMDGPENVALDGRLCQAANDLCFAVEHAAARAIVSRLRFAGLLAEEGDSEAIILEEIQKAWEPQQEPEGGDR